MVALIQTVGVTRVYGTKTASVRALKGIDLTIKQGEFVTIMGPSGSGKSTLMNILGLLDRPTDGQYLFAGENVSALDQDRLAAHRNQHIGFIFQGFNLLPRASAAENVAVPLIYRGVHPAERRSRTAAALQSVGLGERLHHYPQQLSGGEQQRVAIARALVGDPFLLLADEPTGALDSRTGEEILTLFRRVSDNGRTIILITHDASVAQHAMRVISLRDGQLVGDSHLSAPRRLEHPESVVT